MSKHSQDQVQPHNGDAERDLLGALMLNNELLAQVNDFLAPEHFHEPVHQRLYAAIRESYANGDVANPVTLKEKFDRDGALFDLGGAKYLVKLVAEAPCTISAKDYARVIFSMWQRRKIMEWCMEASLQAEDGEGGLLPDEIGAKLVSRINDMASVDKRRQVMPDSEVYNLVVEDLKTGEKPDSTGLTLLDECMGGGLYPSFTYGIAARKKVGKTLLAATLSYNLAKQDIKHLFIAGEMGAKDIHKRVMARQMGVYPSAFRGDYGKSNDFDTKLFNAVTQNRGYAIYQNAPGLTFDELKQYMSRAVYRLKVRGVILDYWQLVGGKASRDSEAKHLDTVAQWIADFCREHRIWSVVFAQINQDGNTRGGEGLRLACDQMYQIHREDPSNNMAWVEMMETRYTQWMNIGDEMNPGWELEERGLYFKEI